MNSNGIGRWVVGGLLALLGAVSGFVAHQFDGRMDALDDRVSAVESGDLLHGVQMAEIRVQICRLEEKIDDLRERVSNRPVYRRPCP